jgi:hypothetical protein
VAPAPVMSAACTATDTVANNATNSFFIEIFLDD